MVVHCAWNNNPIHFTAFVSVQVVTRYLAEACVLGLMHAFKGSQDLTFIKKESKDLSTEFPH